MTLQARAVTAVIDGHRIVTSVGIEVGRREIVGLVGPNGSGKSTLLRCIYRVLRPKAGVISLEEEDVWEMSARQSARRTAVVVQEAPSDFEFLVRDIVLMGRTPHLRPLSRTSAEDHAIAARSLRQVGADHLAERVYPTLSGGEKQRVLLARALAQESRLLVLDEPTNHLDIRHQLEVLELVRGSGVATLAALHDLNLAAAYCDRVYVLDAGEVVAHGRPDVVLEPTLIREVFGVEATTQRRPGDGALHLSFRPIPRDGPAPGA